LFDRAKKQEHKKEIMKTKHNVEFFTKQDLAHLSRIDTPEPKPEKIVKSRSVNLEEANRFARQIFSGTV